MLPLKELARETPTPPGISELEGEAGSPGCGKDGKDMVLIQTCDKAVSIRTWESMKGE
ncbi:MAG: hypothetical protein Q8O41_00350 [Candidatus Methanoperedens sp.]|nr:hypothetical protein [Candidatus Methanoperedens sp.]